MTQAKGSMSIHRRHHFVRRRRGAVYLVVMSMAMLVGAISLGGLLAARAQVRSGAASVDFAVARLCARAGLEVAMWTIRTTPTWRTDLGNGTWFNQIPLGQGAYTVSAADPITGDVTVASNHPVLLTCTGTKGAAVYKMQTTVQVNTGGLPCIGLSLCTSGNLHLTGTSSLTTNQIVASNKAVTVDSNATLNGNAQTVGNFGGPGTYNGSCQTIPTAVTMPDPTNVYSYYLASGAAIPYAALYQSNSTQLVSNTDFETNAAGWYVYSPNVLNTATITQSSAQHKSGNDSLLVSGRLGVGDVPAIDLPLASVRLGDTYAVTAAVYAAATGNVSATLSLQATGGNVSFSTANVALKPAGGWVNVTGNVVPTWSGVLTKATLTLTTSNASSNLYLDAVSLKDTTFNGGAYVMDRVVLSPASNPYGATNVQGVYVLDGGGKPLTIGPCRIVGTLVVKNYGGPLTIQGPIVWEPAVNGYPALLTDKDVAVTFDKSVALSESTYGVNFNPPGTPFPYGGGTSNATASDAFASAINGIVYVGGNATLSTNPSFKGVFLSVGDTNVNATATTLAFDNAAYVNPPPGFSSSTPSVSPVPGSWQRVVGP